MEVFEIRSDKLAELYPELKCDACGRRLSQSHGETWAKAGCGYFCQSCVELGRHLSHPAACRTG